MILRKALEAFLIEASLSVAFQTVYGFEALTKLP
jgi:hypothetical protein